MSVRQVTQKGRLFWLVDVKYQHPDGTIERVRKVAPIQNKRGAEQYERELRQAIADGKRNPPPTVAATVPELAPLFDAFAKSFLETYATTNNKPSEVETKKMILRQHLVPAFGELRLGAIDIEQIERYKASKVRAGLSAKTVNNHLTVLRKLLDVAREWKKLASVPAIKWLKAPEPEFTFLTFDQADRLIECTAPEFRPLITLALRTGLRLGELRALRWCDVDLPNARIVVRRAVARSVIGTPKNGKKREVPLSDQALSVLKAHRHLRGELVFCRADGSMLSKGELKWPLWSACRRASLDRIGWHVLRHTFASHLAMRGAPLKAVQELLGHATIEMTLRYAHLSPDSRREAVRLLDEGGGAKGNLRAIETK
jgi:integrase